MQINNIIDHISTIHTPHTKNRLIGGRLAKPPPTHRDGYTTGIYYTGISRESIYGLCLCPRTMFLPIYENNTNHLLYRCMILLGR